jgi:hypothetical protein
MYVIAYVQGLLNLKKMTLFLVSYPGGPIMSPPWSKTNKQTPVAHNDILPAVVIRQQHVDESGQMDLAQILVGQPVGFTQTPALTEIFPNRFTFSHDISAVP